jgi:hypothetical protein
MVVFQCKHNKASSIFKKQFTMEAPMLPLIFYELNKKFEKNYTIKVGNK